MTPVSVRNLIWKHDVQWRSRWEHYLRARFALCVHKRAWECKHVHNCMHKGKTPCAPFIFANGFMWCLTWAVIWYDVIWVKWVRKYDVIYGQTSRGKPVLCNYTVKHFQVPKNLKFGNFQRKLYNFLKNFRKIENFWWRENFEMYSIRHKKKLTGQKTNRTSYDVIDIFFCEKSWIVMIFGNLTPGNLRWRHSW